MQNFYALYICKFKVYIKDKPGNYVLFFCVLQVYKTDILSEYYLMSIPPISNLRRRGNTHELVMEFSKDVLLVFYTSILFCNRTKTSTRTKKDQEKWCQPSRHEMSLRDLNQISIERDISETSQKHLKKDVFFVTSLRRLKNISKKMSFVWRL